MPIKGEAIAVNFSSFYPSLNIIEFAGVLFGFKKSLRYSKLFIATLSLSIAIILYTAISMGYFKENQGTRCHRTHKMFMIAYSFSNQKSKNIWGNNYYFYNLLNLMSEFVPSISFAIVSKDFLSISTKP